MLRSFNNNEPRTSMTELTKSQYLDAARPLISQAVGDQNVSPKVEVSKNFASQDFSNKKLENLNYKGSVFNYAEFDTSHLLLVDMHSIHATGLSVKNTTLQYVNFSLADLSGASFENSNLNFVSFIGANLENCDFFNVRCTKAVVMIGSNVDPAPNGAIVTLKQLRDAISSKDYSLEELNFLLETLQLSERDVSSRRGSSNKPPYLTENHQDQITKSIKILTAEINARYTPSARP